MKKRAAVFGFVLISATIQSQELTRLHADFKSLEPYVTHSDVAVRRAAVLLLTEAILGEPQPHSGDNPTNARDVLRQMRQTDLDIIFDRCKAAWQRVWKPERFRGPASQYEQMYRFVYVMRHMDSLEGFMFERYVDVKQESLTRLAMSGMALSYTPDYKRRLANYASGAEPLATWAKDALAVRSAPGRPVLTYSPCNLKRKMSQPIPIVLINDVALK